MSAPFHTVLVANRGEIACRIIGTLRRLGARSVAIYSDADCAARHVHLADVAVRVGPPAVRDSYLNVQAIVEAAVRTGAQAIHPGYGFLSENADFAAACTAAGIVFIGPGQEALSVMGDKIRAKQRVQADGVPVIPGVSDQGLSEQALATEAERIGFPLVIKPSAGGGGKGMHVVASAAELPDALASARRIAANAFSDPTVFLERLLVAPRHIEVQVLADNHGTTLWLGERECSLQRRYQKVIEEAPSPLLNDADRRAIGEAACRAAESVDYRGAGTVEFLVPGDNAHEFFFLEMNTRLQVEHPVTELVTGIDLVEQQLRVAAGEPLSIQQSRIEVSGWAMEARVYAESPARGFLPATGDVLVLREPSGEGVRVDSALVQGLTVGADYDPLLAKVIAWGPDRGTALDRLRRALAEMIILGVETNLEYLQLLLADPEVVAGRLHTELIERSLPTLPFEQPDPALLVAAALELHAHREQAAGDSVWAQPSGWRVGEHQPSGYRLQPSGSQPAVAMPIEVQVLGSAAAATVTVGDRHPVEASRVQLPSGVPGAASGSATVAVDGLTQVLHSATDGDRLWLHRTGTTWELRTGEEGSRRESGSGAAPGAGATPEVRSPMPGTVIEVLVGDGDTVETGQTLLVIEAMKMEYRLAAPVPGVVTVSVASGDTVRLDQIVAAIAT